MGVGAYGPSSSASTNASVKLVIAVRLTCHVTNAAHDADVINLVVKPLHATIVTNAHAKSLHTAAATESLLELTAVVCLACSLSSDAVNLAVVTASFSNGWYESGQLQPK